MYCRSTATESRTRCDSNPSPDAGRLQIFFVYISLMIDQMLTLRMERGQFIPQQLAAMLQLLYLRRRDNVTICHLCPSLEEILLGTINRRRRRR